jgi:hypothetical protein
VLWRVLLTSQVCSALVDELALVRAIDMPASEQDELVRDEVSWGLFESLWLSMLKLSHRAVSFYALLKECGLLADG